METTIRLMFYPGLWPVRLWTRSPYGHVSLLVDATVYEAVAAGVGMRPVKWHEADRRAVVVDLPASCSPSGVLDMVSYLNRQIGKPYDWEAICFDVLGVLLGPRARLNIAGDDCWDCSRLVAQALILLGWQCPDLRFPISPGDLYQFVTAKTAKGD